MSQDITTQDITIAGESTLAGKLYLPQKKENIPGVLLCHGFASCKEEFMELPEVLAQQGYGVISFDYRGHGKSEGIRGYFSAHSHLDDTLRAYQALIQTTGIDPERTALIGHSLGTAGVARFLNTKPGQHVQCAILLAPPHQLRKNVEPLEKIAYTALSAISRPVLQLTGQHMYVPYKVKPKDIYVNPAAIQRGEEMNLLQKRISLNNYQYLMTEQDNVLEAEKITLPVMVVVGGEDQLIPKEHSRLVYDALRSQKKEWIEIAGSGHSLLGDAQADLVMEHIQIWLRQFLQEN